jgi:hypothetical protein
MAAKPEKPTQSSDKDVKAEISRQISDLMGKAKLPAEDRSKLRAIVGFMSDDDPEEYDDFMLMYLSGDRDWRDDHAAIFGSDTKPTKTDKKFDITAISDIKVID